MLFRSPLLASAPMGAVSFNASDYLKAGYPPTILLHGNADGMVPVETSQQVYQRLVDTGVKAELHVLEGLSHIFDGHPEFAEAAAVWVDLFLDRHVTNPRQIPSMEAGR